MIMLKNTLALLFICISLGCFSQVDTLQSAPAIFVEPMQELSIDSLDLDDIDAIDSAFDDVTSAMIGVNFSIADTLNFSEVLIKIHTEDGSLLIDKTVHFSEINQENTLYQREAFSLFLPLEEIDYLPHYTGTLQLKYTDNTFSNIHTLNY